MGITKKDYDSVAVSVRYSWKVVYVGSKESEPNAYADGSKSVLNLIVQRMVDNFKTTNPRFSEDVFRRACGQTFEAGRYPQGNDKRWFFSDHVDPDEWDKVPLPPSV